MLKLGWFSTGRGPGSRNLLRTVMEEKEKGLDIEISFVFCNWDNDEEPNPKREQREMFFDMVKGYGIPLITKSWKKFRPDLWDTDQKAWRDDPTAMPLDELSAMAGVNGAKALGINAGRIEVGALADLLIIDVTGYQFLSPAKFLANFIYSAHSDCVESVICDGKFIMRDRVVPGEEQILSDARRVLTKIL